MATTIQNNFRIRKSFAKIPKTIDIPNLIDIQKNSYDSSCRRTSPPDKREPTSASRACSSRVFPIKDFNETSSLEFVCYHLEKPKYDVDECHQRGMTYSAPIKVVVRLVVWDKDEETGAQSIRDVKEQEVYFGEIPLMTENGTFIINGTERVVVSQLHRSPGAFFDHDKGKSHSSGQAALQRPHHPVPRLVDRLRVRPQGPALRAASTAAASCRPRCCCARSAGADTSKKNPARLQGHHRGDPQLLLRDRDHLSSGKDKFEKSVELRPAPRPARHPRHQEPEDRRGHRQEEPQVHPAAHQEARSRRRSRRCPIDVEELCDQGRRAYDVVDEDTGEVLARVQRGGHRGEDRACCVEQGHQASSRSSSSTT